MGWNDHVEFIETECQDCGETDNWEYWDEVGIARYSGDYGKYIVVDPQKPHCPHCGSTNGVIVEDE